MSQNSCCVPGCLITKKHGIPLHRFPKPNVEAGKFNTWIVKIGGEIAELDKLAVYGNRRVCHKHFEDVDKYPSKRLCKLAIPALYLPEQLHTESVTLASLPSTSDIQNIKSDIRKRDQLFTEPVTMPAPCSISGVQETQTTFQMRGIPFHRFPDPKTNPERYLTWVSTIGGLHLQDKKYVYNNLRVCRKHFKAAYLYPKHQLCKLAIPELQLSGAHSVLHGFPNPEKDRFRFNTWLYSIGSDILELENAHIFKFRRVCRKHFLDKYLCRNNRISNIAVPTLYLPGLTLQSQPMIPCIERKPLQGLVNQPIPSTSTAPESHHQLMYTSTSIVENKIQKENIDSRRVLHCFPNPEKHIARFRTWVHVIGGEIIGMSNEDIYKLRRVCHIHFEAKYCCRNNKISNIAVPTLLMPGATNPMTQKELYVCDDPVPTASKASLASLPAPGASRATGPTINITQTQNSSGVENTDICDVNDDADDDSDTLVESNVENTEICDVNDDADDDSDTLVESNVCRVCLALDVEMYDFKDIELREMFQNITGIVVTENNHPILERLCWECAGRLKAAAAFRNQALLSDALLQGLASTGEKIRKNDITLIKENEDYIKSVGSSSAVEVIHIVDIDPENHNIPPIAEHNNTEIVQKTVRNDSIKLKKDRIIKEDKDQMDVKAPVTTEMEYDQFDHICRNTGEESSNNFLETNPVVTNNVPFREDKINSAYSSSLPSCSHVQPKHPVLDYLLKAPSDLKEKIRKSMIKMTKRDSISKKIVSKNSNEVLCVFKGDAKLKNIYVKIGGISKKTSKLKLVKKTQVKANTRTGEESVNLEDFEF